MEGNNFDWDMRLEFLFGPDCIFQYLEGAYFFLLKVIWQLWDFSKMKGQGRQQEAKKQGYHVLCVPIQSDCATKSSQSQHPTLISMPSPTYTQGTLRGSMWVMPFSREKTFSNWSDVHS